MNNESQISQKKKIIIMKARGYLIDDRQRGYKDYSCSRHRVIGCANFTSVLLTREERGGDDGED